MDQTKPSSAARKRRRASEDNKNDASVNTMIITPHTMRLIKVIAEGSPAHAQVAAHHLAHVASTSSSVVLWDILGRLQQLLVVNKQSSTDGRNNAALAMQGVSKYLPTKDQADFLQAHYEIKSLDFLWLTVQDLVKDGGMSTILTKGRLLLSCSQETYDVGEINEGLISSIELQRLDQSRISAASATTTQQETSFLEQRVRLQRQILAQRLGLAGVVEAIGNAVLPSDITRDDLLNNNVPIETNKMETSKKKKRKAKNEDDDDDDEQQEDSAPSIRALLVMEMQSSSSSRSSCSHRNPQTLLATELIFGMFDTNWHVRHGSLLGTLSILKAWARRKRGGDSTAFGIWPQDILARALCILALDRFGDFGDGGVVVAPVRLVAAQLVAILYKMAPRQVQQETFQVLQLLASHEQHGWEVRHGGLLGMQYLLLAMQGEHEDKSTASTILQIAARSLEDDCDDVKAIAAKILLLLAKDERHDVIGAAASPCWKALVHVKSVSACAVDLVLLFSTLLCRDATMVLECCRKHDLSHIPDKMVDILSFESSEVKLATLKAISSLLQSETLQSVNGNKTKLFESYCSTLSIIFESYWDFFSWIDSSLQMESIHEARNETWNVLVKSCGAWVTSREHLVDLLLPVTLRFFGMNQQHGDLKTSNQFSACCGAANALASLWAEVGTRFETNNCVCSIIWALLHSTNASLVENSCLLYQALCRRNQGLPASLERCHQKLLNMIVQPTPCQMTQIDSTLGPRFGLALKESLKSDRFCGIELLETLQQRTTEHHVAAEPTETTLLSVRVFATLACSIVAGGREHLPEKLTPLIRSLMTALKNDTDSDRRSWYCEAVVSLVNILADPEYVRIKNKILDNLCNMLLALRESPGGLSAASVIQGLVQSLPRDGSIEDVSPIWARISPLSASDLSTVGEASLKNALCLLQTLAGFMIPGHASTAKIIEETAVSLILISSSSQDSHTRSLATNTVRLLCQADPEQALRRYIPSLLPTLENREDDAIRLGASKLLFSTIENVDMAVCPYVRCLLPIAMSMMTDRVEACAKQASQTFALLVRVAPLVQVSVSVSWKQQRGTADHSESVMDHLIHGKPLPSCQLPSVILEELTAGGILLRNYQQEGVAWLQFLQTVKLNGALCDDMGVGKTLQSLVAIALAHHQAKDNRRVRSLVVCPSTVVSHWINEVHKYFSLGNLFQVLALPSNAKQRAKIWKAKFDSSNLVITSYSVLRSDIKNLETTTWEYCILDEGHLLKNPKTSTAMAARRIRASHKLILTGTPVQNRVNELWAAFDFLMPNFLGSQAAFAKAFANPISKSHQPGASAAAISTGMEKLKILHQQVLPFILRREKSQVLKELPPKCITDLPCELSPLQRVMYKELCDVEDTRRSLRSLQQALDSATNEAGEKARKSPLGVNVLKSLLYLRLLCTHPALLKKVTTHDTPTTHLESSGKLMVLNELLRTAGVYADEMTAADNDTSVIYFNDTPDETDTGADVVGGDVNGPSLDDGPSNQTTPTKCLIFAQFTQSLDVVEKYLFEPHMPALRYLRIDGSIPPEKRSAIVDEFNHDDSIQVMLLTTRVGGLGLNLSGASMVVLLEHDFNPHADLQAMDRTHRIGQSRTVNVYRLVTQDSIEEKIMKLQQVKLNMSQAIVNTENSTMFSMGTDRLLDIFTYSSNNGGKAKQKSTTNGTSIDFGALDDMYTADDYKSLSVQEFVKDMGDDSTAD